MERAIDFVAPADQEILLRGASARGLHTVPARAFVVLGWGAGLLGLLLVCFGLGAEYFSFPIPGSALGSLGALITAISAALVFRGAASTWADFHQLRKRSKNPEQYWLGDYPWTPQGVRDDTAKKSGQALILALLGLAFAAPTHWIVFAPSPPFLARVVVAVLALLLDLWMIGQIVQIVRHLRQARKFGACRLEFNRFPFFLNEEVALTLHSGHDQPIKATLRCLEERVIRIKRGRREWNETQVWELYRESRELKPDPKGNSLRFFVSGEAKSTSLSVHPIVYWELGVEATDLDVEFLIPVYSPDASPR